MKVPSIFNNKYVRYALIALAAINVLGYMSVKSYECLALFGLSAYSAHCYCKNMAFALLIGLFVANFIFGCGRVSEGFREGAGKDDDDEDDEQASANVKVLADAGSNLAKKD